MLHRGPEPDTMVASSAVSIDGVGFHAVTEADVVDHVTGTAGRRDGGLILTANVDILRQLQRTSHRTIAQRARLVVADGMPVVWASRLQGSPLPERVSGADLVWSLSRAAADADRSVYLLGSAPGVGAKAADALVQANPRLRVVGHHSPPLGFTEDPAVVAEVVSHVADAKPDIVFVALGFPKQERVALALSRALPRSWFLGCGGALDMAAGEVQRAPAHYQRWGLEWVHRLIQEPRRLARRYLRDDIPYALKMLWRASRRRNALVQLPGAASVRTATPKTPAIPAQRSGEPDESKRRSTENRGAPERMPR